MSLFGESLKFGKTMAKRTGTGSGYAGGGSKYSSSTTDLLKTEYAPHHNEGLASAGRTVDKMPKNKGVFKGAAKQQLAAKKAKQRKPVKGSITAAPPRVPVEGPKPFNISMVDDLFGANTAPYRYQ